MQLGTPEPGGMERSLRIRVLAVDDSTVMRSLLRTALGTSPQIELVGTAQDGREALEAIERLNPDLVLLDVEMPCMSGLEVLAEIRARRLRAKVIICSTLTRRGAGITLEALARGAMDYVSKPVAHDASEGIATLRRELLPKILALFPPEGWQCPVEFPYRSSLVPAYPDLRATPGVLVIGVSTGGPAALERILPALPADFPLPVLIAQHMPCVFTSLLAERLDSLCPFSVREAEAGAQIIGGSAYLARGDWHLEVVGASGRSSLRLHQGDSAEQCRPSVDLLFRSAATVYGAGVLALVLTGMGSDGLDGCRAVRAAGGRILVQDRLTSAVWGMPGAVAREGLADRVLPLESIAGEITRFARHRFARPQGKRELPGQLGW
jgi:two-component system chemotaxis response regulator CheB